MTGRVSCHGLEIARDLFAFVNDEVLPGLDIATMSSGPAAKAVADLTAENKICCKRAALQQAITPGISTIVIRVLTPPINSSNGHWLSGRWR